MKIIGKYLGAIAVTALLMTSFTSASAQRGGKDCKGHEKGKQCTVDKKQMCSMLNLNDAQTASFKAIKLKSDKQITPLKNKLNELQARKRTLMTTDKADKSAIAKVIKEMSSTREKVQMIRTTQHLDMRNLLNDEQKVMWDKKNCNHKNKDCKGKGKKHMNKNNRERSHSNCCK